MAAHYRVKDASIPLARAQVWVLIRDHGDGRLTVYRIEDDPSVFATLPAEWLEEIRPPSIDDPVQLPLFTRVDSTGDMLELKHDEEGLMVTAVGRSGNAVCAIVGGNDLRLIARACWQRANALEGGAS